MKRTASILHLVTLLAAVAALPRSAVAAQKFTSLGVAPSAASLVVSAGGNSTNATVTLQTGGNSTSYSRSGRFYLTVSTNGGVNVGPGANIGVSIDNPIVAFTAPNQSTNVTLTFTNGPTSPLTTYTVQVVASNDVTTAQATPLTNTFTVTLSASTLFVPAITWSGGGGNQLWSTVNNWAPPGSPTLSNDVSFVDAGAVGTPGAVNNVVEANRAIGSLTFGQTNNYHTTQISPGVTLTVGGTANGLVTGTGTDPGDAQLVTAAITGAGGTLRLTNQNVLLNVGQAHATSGNVIGQSQATLDLSGLDTFIATPSRLLVGVDLTLKGACGVLDLARTNSIALTPGSPAPQLNVGENSQSGGTPTISSILRLGQTNAILADSISVGRGKTDNNGALMQFNNAFSSPTAWFRGTGGAASRVGLWAIGDGFGSRTYYAFGTCDFSGGSVNALVDSLYVGRGATVNNGSPADSGTGTLTLSAGTMDINTLEVGYSTTLASGNGTVNLNGGVLLVNTTLELAHVSGSLSGTAALNVTGGTLWANAGILAGGGTAQLAITNGTVNVTNADATIGTTASPLNSLSASDASLKLAVQAFGPAVATANLAAGGAADTINISAVPILTGFPAQFPLIQYGLNGGSASGDLSRFVVGTLPAASPAYSAYISNNVANSSIDIVFTGGPFVPALTWDGTPNGNWNTTTPNWRPKTGPDTTYSQGSFVSFNDTLGGTPNVNLTTALSPANLTVSNNSVSYAFSGAGNLTGGMTLLKAGSGSLLLAETGGDNFSGGLIVNAGTLILDNANSAIAGDTTVNGGTLQVGNNDAKGLLPAGNLVDEGAVVFNRTDNLAVSNAISGAGQLTQNNAGILTLSGNSTFSGPVAVAQGTLQVGNSNALALVSSVTVSTGASFDVNGTPLFGNGNAGLVVTVAGAGVGGNGAIVNSGGSASKVLHTVTLTGDTTFGGNGDWDIRNSSGSSASADAQLNGAFNLTKTGTNTVSFRGVTLDSGLNNINVLSGGLTITATASAPVTTLGNPSATVTVQSNATLTLDTIGTVPAKNFVLNNGGTLKGSSTNVFGDALTLSGAANNGITVISPSQFTITSAINGAGGFAKNGSGVLFLSAANTYSGNTTVSGGTLALYGTGDGSIGSSVNLNVTSGATLDVSGRSDSTLTLVGGQTLNGGASTNGPGLILGSLVANVGSVLAPGTAPTNTGALTVSSAATLHGTTVMKLNAGTGANDRLNANSLTYGGSLVVSNIAGSFTSGQVFQLFFATNGNYSAGSFSGGVTLPSAAGVTWNNRLAIDGSLVVLSALPSTPTNITYSLSGSTLTLTWPANYQGWLLQSNTVGVTSAGSWFDVPNSGNAASYPVTIDPLKANVFFRLRHP